MKIAVLGDGAWGTALAVLLCGNGHDVALWGPFADNVAAMRAGRENREFLPGLKFPANLQVEGDMAAAVDGAALVVLASPSQYMRGTLGALRPSYSPEVGLVNVAKGVEDKGLRRMSQLCDELLGANRYAVLSGPSHAEEVSHDAPTAVVAASVSAEFAAFVRGVFMNPRFRVYSTTDVIGVELGGALKNVIAIAAGIIDGLGLGDNTKAALMTRGVAEMARLGVAVGGRAETFAGLSGVGDLIVTCGSRHSRNRRVGEELGRGKPLDEIVAGMNRVVAEGVRTADSAWRLARELGVETPIIAAVRAIIHGEVTPPEALADLMTRKPKNEGDEFAL